MKKCTQEYDECIKTHSKETCSSKYNKCIQTILSLPVDVQIEILYLLPIQEINKYCMLAQGTNKTCRNRELWRKLILRDFGIKITNQEILNGGYSDDLRYEYGMFNKYAFNTSPSSINEYGKYMLSLDLTHDEEVSDDDLKYTKKLERLNLSFNRKITGKGLNHLKNLKELTLTDNHNITDEDLKYVPGLTYLDLDYNDLITYKGLEYLPNLKVLIMSYANPNMKSVNIKTLFPGIDVRRAYF